MSGIQVVPPNSGFTLAGGYRDIPVSVLPTQLGSASPTGTYIMPQGVVVGAAGTGRSAFRLDPADYPTIAGLSKMIRVRGWVITDNVAPGASVTFNFGLYPVATWSGTSATPIVATVGAATASTGTITNPSAGGPSSVVDSGDVAFPAAGPFVVCCVVGGAAFAANAIVIPVISLQMRWA